MDRMVHRSLSLSMRFGRYAAILSAVPTVLGSIKELRAIASALDRAETQRENEHEWTRFVRPSARSAA